MAGIIGRLGISIAVALLMASCGGEVALMDAPVTVEREGGEVNEVPMSESPELPEDAERSEDPELPQTSERIVDIQVLMQQQDVNCTNSSCHDSTPGSAKVDLLSGSLEEIAIRLVGQASSNQNCSDERLIDAENPENSLLLKLVDPMSGDQCMAKMPFGKTGVTTEQYQVFADWVDDLIAVAPPLVFEPPPSPPSAEAARPLSIVNKAKLILHGGAVSEQELDRVTNDAGDINISELQGLISEWMQTPEFEIKISRFLELGLQQDIFNASDLYLNQFDLRGRDRVIDVNKTRRVLKESFIRTAMRIVKNNDDFRGVVTTRDWEVTTAMLAMLTHADQAAIPRDMKFKSFPGLVDSDYEDWRTVRLTQGTEPAEYNHTAGFLNSLRAIDDDGEYALYAPRVGFFNSPIFIENWETNVDNQFRINTNQTMIAALGLTFEAGDTTAPHHLDGLAQEHAPTGTDCFACHQHLDPMRNAFARYYSPDNLRALNEVLDLQPDFAFQGTRTRIQTMDDFANAIAQHPKFAAAWTAKLCQWATSVECDQNHPEFQRVANAFQQSGFQFQGLITNLFSSPFLTELTNVGSEPIVSVTRKTHYCDALSVRLSSVRRHRNLSQKVTNYCDSNGNVRNYSGLLPDDFYVRGQVPFVQSNQTGPLLVKSMQALCDVNAASVVGGGVDNTFTTRDVNRSLDDMVTFIMGVPTNDEKYSPARTALQQVYEVSRAQPKCANAARVMLDSEDNLSCGFGLGANQALRTAWKVACSSPSLMGLGL